MLVVMAQTTHLGVMAYRTEVALRWQPGLTGQPT
jgi:hypothetical protein